MNRKGLPATLLLKQDLQDNSTLWKVALLLALLKDTGVLLDTSKKRHLAP